MTDSKRRILLVDDEPDIGKVVGKYLEVAGFEVLVAADGEEGIAMARAERPDLIILDIMMPRLSGIEVCLSLRKEPQFQQTPIIFYTGKDHDDVIASMPQNSQRLQQWGANAFVKKTEGGAALVKQIRALLGIAAPGSQPSATG
jgi:two-component system alkaline phosphatase synthesis response regulator PhoP